jgi:hypothetical protein
LNLETRPQHALLFSASSVPNIVLRVESFDILDSFNWKKLEVIATINMDKYAKIEKLGEGTTSNMPKQRMRDLMSDFLYYL